jgi:hypothetical protein
MRATRLLLTALATSALVTVPACSSDDGDDTTTTAPSATEATDTTGGDGADAGGADGGSTPVDVPDSGIPLSEVLTSTTDFPDSTELITAIQVLGSDRPGYVADTTIVAQATDEPGDVAYLCAARRQLDLATYEIVLRDTDGSVIDDC